MRVVDVIIPARNAERTLSSALESIVQQEYSSWLAYVINDASTDGTAGIAEAYALADSRISVIHKTVAGGPGAAMNTGLLASSSPFIAVMHADDLACPVRLARQVSLLETDPEIDVVGSQALLWNEAADLFALSAVPSEHSEIVGWLPLRNPLIHPTVMMRREFLLRSGGYGQRFRTEDVELWLRSASIARFANIDEALLIYRLPARTSLKTVAEGVSVRWSSSRFGYSGMDARLAAVRFGVTATLMMWGFSGISGRISVDVGRGTLDAIPDSLKFLLS